MKRKLLYLILFSISWSVGMQALNVPYSYESVSSSQTGIADLNFNFENPSFLIQDSEDIIFGFSFGNWIWDTKLNSAFYRNHSSLLRVYSLGNDGLELYEEDIPRDNGPLDYFGTQFICLEYSRGIKVPFGIYGGLTLRGNYVDLLLDNIYGINIDVSAIKPINNRLSVGLNYKNIKILHQKSDGVRSSLPVNYGFGLSYIIPVLEVKFLYDYKYLDTRDWGHHLSLSKVFGRFSFIFGYSNYKNIYESFSYGMKILLTQKWSISYSNINQIHFDSDSNPNNHSIGLNFLVK